jgi:tRNA(adenine34) deaminase
MKFEAADELAMMSALQLAHKSLVSADVPVGALVIDSNGEVIGQGWNQREALHDPTAHAEVIALREAAEKVGSWRLDGATLVVTLEPCVMCAGAILNARISRIVFGADEPKTGAVGSVFDVIRDRRQREKIEVVAGVKAAECAQILQEFFREHRPVN